LIQRAMVEGRPDEGVLPSGQVAAVIGSLPSVAELIDGIVTQAQARLAALLPPASLTAASVDGVAAMPSLARTASPSPPAPLPVGEGSVAAARS